MGEQTWTKEPWGDDIGAAMFYDGARATHNCLDKSDFQRAKACVNALAGIPDPTEYVARVKRLVEVVAKAQDIIAIGPHMWGGRAKVLDELRAVLADLASTSKPGSGA